VQRFGNPDAITMMQQINDETATLSENPEAGLTRISKRLIANPDYYGAWYLWQKPRLLWSWEIQLGPGDVYVLEVKNSPLETHPLLRWCSIALRYLNPLLSLLALCAVVATQAVGNGRGVGDCGDSAVPDSGTRRIPGRASLCECLSRHRDPAGCHYAEMAL
jgi:hypothetical protein